MGIVICEKRLQGQNQNLHIYFLHLLLSFMTNVLFLIVSAWSPAWFQCSPLVPTRVERSSAEPIVSLHHWCYCFVQHPLKVWLPGLLPLPVQVTCDSHPACVIADWKCCHMHVPGDTTNTKRTAVSPFVTLRITNLLWPKSAFIYLTHNTARLLSITLIRFRTCLNLVKRTICVTGFRNRGKHLFRGRKRRREVKKKQARSSAASFHSVPFGLKCQSNEIDHEHGGCQSSLKSLLFSSSPL